MLQEGSRYGVVKLWNTLTSCGVKNSTNLLFLNTSRLQLRMEAVWSEMETIRPVMTETATAKMSC